MIAVELATSLLAQLFKIGTAYVPTNIKIALTTAVPKATDNEAAIALIEPSGNAYARATLDPSASSNTNWKDATCQTWNTAAITFPAPTGSWGTLVGFAIIGQQAGPVYKVLFTGALGKALTVDGSSPAPRFSIGQLLINLCCC